MKDKIEGIAVAFAIFLSLLIVYLIVQYNLISYGATISEVPYDASEVKKVSKKDKTRNYLQAIEGHTEVEVEIDPTQEGTTNIIEVESELSDDGMANAVSGKDQKRDTQTLENYSSKKSEDSKPKVREDNEPKKLEHEEIVDEIGLAIGAALEDP